MLFMCNAVRARRLKQRLLFSLAAARFDGMANAAQSGALRHVLAFMEQDCELALRVQEKLWRAAWVAMKEVLETRGFDEIMRRPADLASKLAFSQRMGQNPTPAANAIACGKFASATHADSCRNLAHVLGCRIHSKIAKQIRKLAKIWLDVWKPADCTVIKFWCDNLLAQHGGSRYNMILAARVQSMIEDAEEEIPSSPK